MVKSVLSDSKKAEYTSILATVVNTDLGKVTIKKYLHEIFKQLWFEKESFSGKRPFGNSGWEFCIYRELIKAKVITGSVDDGGYVESIAYAEADEYVSGLIDYIFSLA